MATQTDIELLLPFVTRASRYLGNEINTIKKDHAGVEIIFCLAFPDAYEIGMSHLGLQILYAVLNAQRHIACERAFAPWPDMEAELQRHDMPLATLESRRPLAACDILGFSLEYELSYATVVRMLALARIPACARHRDASYPLVIAGGPSTYNPEPVADFFDAMVIGEGEEVLLEICDAYSAWKKRGASKQDLLTALSRIPGVYVPSFFEMTYHDDGTLREIIPLQKGYTRVVKRVIAGFNDAPFCTSPVVPYMQIIHDRACIEIARGCSRGCRFCMAGMIYRPVREKGAGTVLSLTQKALLETGYEECALASLSSGDFSGITTLIQHLMEEQKHKKVAVSFPSLRVETLTRELMDAIKQVRKTGFTIAPEAGTQRLRDVINKNITEEEILHTVSQIFSAGWNLVKLYFMIGLPTETTADIEGIVALCKKISALDRRKQINVSISTFVPKPHTPFQWEAQDTSDTILAKQQYLRSSLRARNIHVACHNHKVSMLEGIFSRGDRRLSDVLLQAHTLGAGFEAWTEYFNPDLWDQAFQDLGIDTQYYLGKKELDACLAWSHISCGIDETFLKQERAKAFQGETTADCRTGLCTECGVCKNLALHMELNPETADTDTKPAAAPSSEKQIAYTKYRLCYTKTGPARFLSHLELGRTLARAMRRAQLPLKYSQGFHPLPRITFYDALPVGMESLAEFCDIELSGGIPGAEVFARIQCRLPEGITLEWAREMSLKKRPENDTLKKYRVNIPQNTAFDFPACDTIRQSIDSFNEQTQCVISYRKNDVAWYADLKLIVRECTILEPNALEIVLTVSGEKIPKVSDIVGRILNLGEREKKALRIIKINEVN